MIVHESRPVTLIGGGKLEKNHLKRAQAIGNHVVAADGGAVSALQAGVTPSAVIGDFDSIHDEIRDTLPPGTLHPIAEQDSTDFDKCLRNIAAPLILSVGFAAPRIDHLLANLNTLARYPDRRCILIGSTDIAFLAPPALVLELDPGTPVSLFPMGVVEGISEGLKWPIAGLTFTPDGRVGTSNEAIGPITLQFTAPKMLLILPTSALESTADVLVKTVATWPAI